MSGLEHEGNCRLADLPRRTGSRRFEKESFQRGLRLTLLNETGRRLGEERGDLCEYLRRGVFENQFSLVFDSEKIVHPALPDENPLCEDADPVADFLDLREKMRGEQNGDALPFQFQDEVLNVV